MTDTKTLIEHLTSDMKPTAPLASPRYNAVRLLVILGIYAAMIQVCLGLRPDLATQWTRPFFTAEILLLALLAITSALAGIIAMAPDAYQKPLLLRLPYLLFALLAVLVVSQLFMPADAMMVLPKPGAHAMECALCIASVALIPSALIFILLRKGASVAPSKSGAFAVLTASALGCLTLRLAEANDSIAHLAGWHYLPTLLFAIIGAFIGKYLLKW